MLITIEGVDKAGKTTLASLLSKKLNWPLVHFGKPGPDPATEYIQFIEKSKNVVCDRFYVGELIYGPLLRGKQSMTPLQMITIERLCRRKGCILVHVAPDYETIELRLNMLGDEMVTHEQNKKAYEMFEVIIPLIKIGPRIVWRQEVTIERVIGDIVDQILEVLTVFSRADAVCSGIGSVLGKKIVLVGEAINKDTTWQGYPFDNGSSAVYLMNAMTLAGVQESAVYITNASTITADETRFLMDTGETRFVSLGNKAHDKLKLLGINSSKVPHPQFWSRFHHHSKVEYSKLIIAGIEEAPIYNVNFNFV